MALWIGALADEVTVAVGFYPALPWERMSPTWASYAGKAGDDPRLGGGRHVAAAGVQAAVRGIEAAGGTVEVYDYPGTSHAFFNDERPEVYDAEQSATAWRRTVDLLRRRL